MKKTVILFVIFSLFVNFAYAQEDISRIISHYNKQTEDYTPQNGNVSDAVFADLIGYEWAHKSIYALFAENIVSGRASGVFDPGDNVKIKEFVKLVVLTCGLYDENALADFQNVGKDDWSYHYIASAQSAGVLDFFAADTDFEAYITREQMAVMCAKALGFLNIELNGEAIGGFADDEEIDYRNKRYIYALKNLQLVSGMGDGSFMPKSNLRRCDSAVIIYRLHEFIKNSI